MTDSERFVIGLNGDLTVRLPRGDFTDASISGLVATSDYSTAGDVQVRRWTQDRIDAWYREKARYDKWGCYLNRAIRACHRSPGGDGAVQRLARRINLPLYEPQKSTTVVQNTYISMQPTAFRFAEDTQS